MVSISEARQSIETGRRQAIESRAQATQTEQQLKEAERKIPEYKSQEALRKSQGIAGREERRNLSRAKGEIVGKQTEVGAYKEQISEYEKGLTKSEQELNAYLQTDAGKLQYAKEMGIQPNPQESYMERPYYNYPLMNISVYDTPYGKVADTTELEEAKAEAYRTEAKVASMGLPTAYQFGATQEALGKASGSALGLATSQQTAEYLKTGTTIIGGTIFTSPDYKEPLKIVTTPQNNDIFVSGIGKSGAYVSKDKYRDTGTFRNIRLVSNMVGKKTLEIKKKAETYISGIGEFGMFAPSNQRQDTGTISGLRTPTLIEIKNIKEAKIRNEAISAVPAQYLGTFFNKQLPESSVTSIGQENKIKGFFSFLNPKTQYDIAKYDVQYKEDIKLLNKANKPLTQAETQFNEGKITAEEYNQKLIGVTSRPNYQEAYERVKNTGGTSMERLAKADISEKKKFVLSTSVGVVQTIPYFIAPTRAVLGVEAIREGSEAYSEAETKGQKLMAGSQVALGGLLTISGVKGTIGGTSSALQVSQRTARVLKYGEGILGTTASIGFGGLEYYSTYKQTGSKSVALGKALGTGGTILAGTFYQYSPIKLKYGEVEGVINKEPVGLEGYRAEVAKSASKAGGYVEGSSAIEAKYGKKLFREGSDLDIGILGKDVKKLPAVSKAVEKSLKEQGISFIPDEKLNSPLNPSGSPMAFKNPKTGKPIVEIHIRENKVKVIDIGGTKFRAPKEVIEDKYQILRVANKGKENVPEFKLLKTERDIKLIESAEEVISKPSKLYGGIYLQIGESTAKPLFGFANWKPVIGTPTAKNIPKLSLLEWSKRNIATYPQTPLETEILTRRDVLVKMGASEGDIRKIEIIKSSFADVKDQASKYLTATTKFPEETKILDVKETSVVKAFTKKNQDFERVYGSFSDIPQRAPRYKRLAGDIEYEFTSKAKAELWGKNLVNEAKSKGINLEFKEEKGLGIYKQGEKAIELKYPEDEFSKLELSKGSRYGFIEYRNPTQIEGVKVQTEYEQLIRKGGASATWWGGVGKEEGKLIIEPPAHRAKDIVDYYAIGKTLAESKGGIKGDKLSSNLEELRKLEWRNPETKKLFGELDKNAEAYLSEIKKDITGTIKPSKVNVEVKGFVSGITTSPSMKTITPESKNIISIKSVKSETSSVSAKSIISSLISPSPSPSISTSPSKSISPSLSMSPSKSISPSLSVSPSPSKSPSPSRSVSPSPSKSPSPSPSPSKSPRPSPPSSGGGWGSSSSSNKKQSAKETINNLYDIIRVSKGQEQVVGESQNLFGAGKSLKKTLKETLSASGFIKEKRTGRKISYGEIASLLGGEFTSGKRDTTRIVQRREFRLGTRPEVFKIQEAKKRGKVKWL